MPPMKTIMSTTEVADLLGVSSRSVNTYIREGRLNAMCFSAKNSTRKHCRVTSDQLTEFINNSSIQPKKLRSKIKREL